MREHVAATKEHLAASRTRAAVNWLEGADPNAVPGPKGAPGRGRGDKQAC